MARREKEPPPVYECKPPEWLPKVHTVADLGYVGFFPPRPDQEEEVLTENNVKNGLHQTPFVPLETYSAQEPIRTRLVAENALFELEELMNQIIVRKTEDLPAIAPSTFRLPSRVTLNDGKRQAWFKDLANPDVPLQKLGKSVPHGAKGHDLLDLLHEHNVAVPRAVWFLRVFGGNETVGLRNKPHYNPTQYSVDWANLVTGYLRKQLTLVALPMAPRPGLNIKQTFKGVLAEPDSRERWLSRFNYSLNLLRAFYAEGLVDNRTFLLWLVQQVATCNLAQLGFVCRMVDEYLDGMLTCRPLAGPLVEFTLCRLSEIRTTPGNEHLVSVVTLLRNVLLRMLLALPDAFINPRIWAQHSGLLEEALLEYSSSRNSSDNAEQNTQSLDQTFDDILSDLRRRNDAMLFRFLPPSIVGHLSSALADIKLLNSLSGRSDLGAVLFFERSPDHLASFPEKVDILLTWSVTPLQHGDHRPYAAVSLLRFWCLQEEERAIRRGRESPHDFMQDQLFDWLDSSEIAADADNLHSVALVFGQLVKQGLFSYPQYIQRLIARGEQGLDYTQENESRHRSFVRWIPLYESSSSLIAQRKVTLYGARARETPEDINERGIRKQIRLLLPELFGGSHTPIDLSSDFCSICNDLFSATRFEQVRLMNGWLLPLLKKWIAAQSPNATFDASDPLLQTFCIATTLLARCRSYGTMLDLTLFTLEHATSNELLTAVLRTLRQHVEVWACMNKMQNVTTALYEAHTVWKSRGVRSRPLMKLLIELDDNRLLEQAARDQVLGDYAAFSYALRPPSEQPQEIPATLPEILLLATDNSPDAPTALANSLWYNYRSAPNWDWLVWDNTVAALQHLPGIIEDEVVRKACSYKYATFLTHVDQHLPDGFDEPILSWFQGSGQNEITKFSTEVWDELSIILFYLSIHGALATTTILTGLIYPIWRSASVASTPKDCAALELQLNAVNMIFDHLLLQETCIDGIPPSNFYELQGLQTRRRDAFRHPHFVALAESIPTLVLIEHNVNLSPSLQDRSRLLRETLCAKSVFRLGIYRDLETVHRAFETVLGNRDVAEELHEPLIYALKVMFSEDHASNNSCIEQWQILSTSLTPWKLAATSIELRFTIKQLEEALARDGSREKARQALNRITASLFKQGMCSEEVDLVTGIVKGASVEIVARFVNAGLQRISELLKAQPRPRQPSTYPDIAVKIGEVLRFVTSIADTCREDAITPGQIVPLDTLVQDNLMVQMRDELAAIEDVLKAARDAPSKLDDVYAVSHATVVLSRVIQFTLGFPVLWGSKTRTEMETLSASIFNLALLYGSGITLDTMIFPLLIDTLYYLLDEIPSDPKAASYNPSMHYPKFELQQLPSDTPATYRSCLRTLLPFVPLNASVADLVYVSKDGDTTTTPVPNRPWEWMEHLGDRPVFEAKDEKSFENTVKNVASLPLDLFDTRVVAKCSVDTTADNASDGAPGRQQVQGSLNMLQDTSHTESIFQRDWRESRTFAPSLTQDSSHPEVEDEVGPLLSLTATERRSNSSRMASPVSSVRSRGSVQPSGSSFLHLSPSQLQQQRLSTSGSTASEAIDVDSLNIDLSNAQSSTSQFHGSNKRKATDNDDDEDVIEVLQGASSSQKRSKTKTSSTKSKQKKR